MCRRSRSMPANAGICSSGGRAAPALERSGESYCGAGARRRSSSKIDVKLPHPVILLIAGVAVCAVLTWILPAGAYDRRDDPATGRSVVVAGTYHRVDPAPVGPFAAAVAIPRGFVEAADVIGVVLFVGAAWIVVDRIGTPRRPIAAPVAAVGSRGLIAVPPVSLFFATVGAREHKQEGIHPPP